MGDEACCARRKDDSGFPPAGLRARHMIEPGRPAQTERRVVRGESTRSSGGERDELCPLQEEREQMVLTRRKVTRPTMAQVRSRGPPRSISKLVTRVGWWTGEKLVSIFRGNLEEKWMHQLCILMTACLAMRWVESTRLCGWTKDEKSRMFLAHFGTRRGRMPNEFVAISWKISRKRWYSRCWCCEE